MSEKPTPLTQEEIDKYNRKKELEYNTNGGKHRRKNALKNRRRKKSPNNKNDKDLNEKGIRAKNSIDLNKRFQNPDIFTLPPETFTTPEMGDFYLGAVDDMYLKKLDEILNDEKPENVVARNAAFYTETPKHTALGYNDSSLFIKARINEDGWINGETLRIPISSVDAGSKEATAKFINELNSSKNPYANITEKDTFSFQMYGMSAPKMNRYATESNVPLEKVNYKAVVINDIKGDVNYVYDSTESHENGYCNFVRIGSKWYQMNIIDKTDQTISFKWLANVCSGDKKNAFQAWQKAKICVDKSGGEVYLQIDRNAGVEKADNIFQEISSDVDARDTLLNWAGNKLEGENNGFCLAKQDFSARRTGIAYVKIDGKWVNLAKAMLVSGIEDISVNDERSNFENKDFDQNYDIEAQIFADAYFKVLDEIDDRKKIQKEIFGKDWGELHNWTVTIGDVTLLIPPTSITVVSEIEEQRVPLLRANGSMPKTGKRDIRTIGMSIYFAGDNSINGYTYKTKSPRGKEFTYSLNGLRSLIAEFKFTPFVPIENKYLNETLGIQAVTFNSLSLSNVPSVGPRLIEAQLTLTEFDYSVYIPEAAVMGAQNNRQDNWFSASINWPVMRYYYQRCISAGDQLGAIVNSFTDEKGETKERRGGVNSNEYIEESLKHGTALQPMQFQTSDLKFYVADQDYLEKMLDAKRSRKKDYLLGIDLKENDRKAITKIGGSLEKIYEKLHSSSFKRAVDELNKLGNLGYKDENIIFDKESFGDVFRRSNLVLHKDNTLLLSRATDETLNKTLGPILSEIKEYEDVSYAHFISDARVGNDAGGNYAKFGIEIIFKDKNINNEETIRSIQGNVGALIQESEDDFFKEGRIFIPLTMTLESSPTGPLYGRFYRGASKLELNDECPEMKFLKYCIEYKKAHEKPDDKPEKEWDKSPDIAQLDLMKFVPLDCGDFVVKSFSAQLANRQSRINLQDVSGSTPQYLGGEDTYFNVSVVTTSEKTASELSLLPKRTGYIMRRYREVIPCFPLKVDSEFTRFLGVNEVTLTNVRVSTVPNQPGVYQIDFNMISAERTLRNREAFEMLSANNSGKRFSSATAAKNVRSYFDFENTIAQAELYPDLELPRLDEMLGLGWEFVRYKFQDSRVYVDPDFYFVYLNQLSSQILREGIVKSIEHNVDGTKNFEDIHGAQFTIKPEKYCGYTTEAHNDLLEKQLDIIKKAKSSKYSLNAKETKENLKETSKHLETEDYETWTICNDIKAMFMENRYKKEYESYISRIRSKDLSAGVDAVVGTARDYSEEEIKKMSGEQLLHLAGNTLTKKDTSKEPTDTTQTEGKWVSLQLSNAHAAAKKIEAYLKDNAINIEVPDMNVIREKFIQARRDGEDTKSCYDALKTAIQNAVAHFFSISEVKEILELLNFDLSYSFVSTAKDIVFAAACAATGEKEFSSKKKSTNWFPAPDFIGVSSGGGIQDATNATVLYEVDKAVENATEFGTFKIKLYTREEFIDFTGEEPMDPWDDNSFINTSHWLLDRYYRYQPKEAIDLYKKGCINSVEFCTHAFLRNTLYWLKYLIDKHALPSINADILRKATHTELDIQKKEEDLNVDNKSKNIELRNHIQFFSKNLSSIDAGKLWTIVSLTASDGNKMLRNRINDRDYRGLNEYVRGCSVPKTTISVDDKASIMMRKMNLALIGQNRIKDSDATGVPQDLPAIQHARDFTEKKYIEAAEDPKQFMVHSCHDMIVHDARGRMLRAFPTYYMILIDEGREIGTWKLHDNFYNSMSIMEFTIVKDRKNPADTATIKLSNLYQSYHTEEEDRLRLQEGSWDDVWDSIMSPDKYGQKLEDRRSSANVSTNIRLHAGARIHLRAGYGSNAAMMPILFNGVIAEVTAQDTIDIVAQGDGIELMNPIMEKEEVHDLTNDWSFFRNGGTPKTIMDGLLNYNGGLLARKLKDLGRGDLLGDNPFGIYHFGNKEFTEIAKNGECCQNIYEAWSKPSWGDGSNPAEMPHAPSITMDVFGKTVWDIANICKSTMPDFICSVAPFNLRSTLFIGAPRYYYAYNYTNVNGAIQEKRKPFQQYHIYTSGTDIIANGITASSKKIKTTATGLFKVCSMFNVETQHTVGPIYADIDIYPEYQKSMIVDTQYLAKGVPYLGAIGLNVTMLSDTVDKLLSEGTRGTENSGNKANESIAWRMTASALKDSMKEMYCGDMVLMGDPTIKPHDRMFIVDSYTGIGGQATAKEVVHHMSVEEGFITTVSPDCINAVDDRFEQVVHSWMNSTGSVIAGHMMTTLYIGYNALMLSAGKSEKILTISKALNAMKPQKLIDKAASSKYGTKILEKGGKIAGEVGEAGKGILNSSKFGRGILSGGKKLLNAGKIVVGAGAAGSAGGPIGVATAVATTLVGIAVMESIGPIASILANDFMKNLQAITVYPLTRYGLAWTAGMQGSKGAIFGTPSYEQQGSLTNLFTSFVSPNNACLNGIMSMLFSEETQAMAEKLKRKNGYNPINKTADKIENTITDTAKSLKE